MTIEEFNEIEFTGSMRASVNGEKYFIIQTDFEEKTITIDDEKLSEIYCKHVEEIY